jgi:hypothetical protein
LLPSVNAQCCKILVLALSEYKDKDPKQDGNKQITKVVV